jgi:hypothetical protein
MKIKALDAFTSHEEIEESGVWTTIAPGVEWKIRRMRSKAVERAKDRLYGPHELAMNGKKIPDALEIELTKKLMSQALVVDWRGEGMVDDSGNPIPFTAANAFEILSDKDTGKDLRSTIISLSMNGELFVPDSEVAIADAKN